MLSRTLEQTLRRSLQLASKRRHEYATLEHLLLALADDSDAATVLRAGGVDPGKLRADLTAFLDKDLSELAADHATEPMPTAGFQRVVQRAAIHVHKGGRDEVSGANVLVALFSERESHAVYFLHMQGMTRLDALNFISHGLIKAPGRTAQHPNAASTGAAPKNAEHDEKPLGRNQDAPSSKSFELRWWAATNFSAHVLASPWTLEALAAANRAVFPSVHPRTRAALVVRMFALGEDTYPPTAQALARFLLQSDFFKPPLDRPVAAFLDPPRFAPAPNFDGLPIPALATEGDLASWLGLSPGQLDWLSNFCRTHGSATERRFQNYTYAFIGKRGGKQRLLEAPKPKLKAIQRRILHEILVAIPVHRCAHGFVRRRSCLTGAQIHASEAVVITFDLAQFFPSIGLPRIHGLFRSLGYPWAVARHLAGLCTTVTPTDLFGSLPDAQRLDRGVAELYRQPHLPQGAPTSPALANLLAWTLDRRLHGLATAAGANYTRYADDLAFSGGENFARGLGRFSKAVARIVDEEGFALNPAKTRIMPRSQPQRVTGIVVNAHINVARRDYDTLRATLHNCIALGPISQNRAAHKDFRRHLDGRITWVEQVNMPHGAKLRRLFDRIDWPNLPQPP
jgi:retron-type reverse transcriptase